jgi:HEAT repeat protein
MRAGELLAKRLPLLVGVLLVAALGGLVCWMAAQPRRTEPVYGGKPLSYWLARPLAQSPPDVWYSQAKRDSDAVPFLIRALRIDSWVGAAYYRKWLWPKLPTSIQKHLPTPSIGNSRARCNAATLLCDMGPMAKPAIPALIRALKEAEDASGTVRVTAASALGEFGAGDKTAIAALTEAFGDAKYPGGVRSAAADALRRIDPDRVVKALREDGNSFVRLLAASALGSARGKVDQTIMAALTDALKDRSASVRAMSAHSLGRVGEADAACITALIAALKDEDPMLRRQTAESLGKLGKGYPAAVAALTEALMDTDRPVRQSAANALLDLDPDAAAKAGVRYHSVLGLSFDLPRETLPQQYSTPSNDAEDAIITRLILERTLKREQP